MLLHLFKMSRPVNIVIAMVTLSIGYYLLSAMPTQDMGISWTTLVLQTLGFACAIGFANIQNDIWDLETDRLNRPERPLVSGKVPMGVAQKAWVVLLVLGIACGIAESLVTETGFTSAIFFVLLTVLLVAYNKWFKHIPLLKNMTVALMCATPLFLCLFYPMMFLIVAGSIITPCVALIIVFAHKRNYRRSQKLVKVAMFAGLVALLVSC